MVVCHSFCNSVLCKVWLGPEVINVLIPRALIVVSVKPLTVSSASGRDG